MKTTTLLGVTRNKKFSPNHVGNDGAIFSLVTQELEKMGYSVQLWDEDTFLAATEIPQQYIFTMARQKRVVKKLQQLENEGKTIVNSGFGIENCFRTNMTKNLLENGIPYPKSYIVPTDYDGDEVFENLPGKGFWVKRGDFHAIHKEDVSFAATAEEAKEMLQEYALREIPDAVISEHLRGDLVKFYAVRNTDFFFWFYPYANNHHKYAEYEHINGQSVYYPFDEKALQQAANASAEVLNIHIYGGDAIIDKHGNFHLIDVNDWPSFAPCRQEASVYIAQAIAEQFELQPVAVS